MRSAVTAILLLFVAASVAYLVVSEARSRTAATGVTTDVADEPAGTTTDTGVQAAGGTPTGTGGRADGGTQAGAGGQAATGDQAAPAVVVYYFHGTMRCHTCLTMEQFAREAIEDSFRGEIESGQVRWRPVNYDEPASERFVKDYGLVASTLLIARDSAAEPSWRKLERIWDLVADEAAFKAYVVDEVKSMLRSGR